MTTAKRNICHILPCSIDDDMTAYTARYFHHTPLPKNDGADDTTKKDHNITIMAAQFRGRGLLCVTDTINEKPADENVERISTLPEGMTGLALAPTASHATKHESDQNNNSRSLKVVETFSQVYNWQHDHDPEKIKRSRNDGASEKVGLKAILGWCELSHAVRTTCCQFYFIFLFALTHCKFFSICNEGA